MKVMIVEDEAAAADNLTYLLRKIDPAIEVAAFSESVEQTVEILSTEPVFDLIFMDIHLSDGSAFAIFDQMNVKTPIVFTTAYDQYALEAFKVNSIDYLLKPVRADELKRAIEKCRMRAPHDVLDYIASMAALAPRPKYQSRLLVPVRDKIIPVAVSEICYAYSTNRQTELVTADGAKLPIGKTLEQLLAMLSPGQFCRANKQFVVAKDSIVALEPWPDSRILVKMRVDTPEPLFVSKNSASEFKRWLAE